MPTPPATDPRFGQVLELLALYYDALYRGDSKDLALVFHPEAHYFCASTGELLHLDMGQYFVIVDDRRSPEENGESYRYQVDSIEFAGPMSAFVRLRCRMLHRDYTDLLSLVQVGDAWQIVSKVFHYETVESEED